MNIEKYTLPNFFVQKKTHSSVTRVVYIDKVEKGLYSIKLSVDIMYFGVVGYFSKNKNSWWAAASLNSKFYHVNRLYEYDKRRLVTTIFAELDEGVFE